jgi:hypothetical protein
MNTNAVQQVATNNAGGSPNVNVPNVEAPNPAPIPQQGMAEGGTTSDNTIDTLEENTAMDKTQWLTIFLIGLTIVSLVMSIVSNRKQIQKLDKDDSDMNKKMNELETNLRKQMGDKYEELA